MAAAAADNPCIVYQLDGVTVTNLGGPDDEFAFTRITVNPPVPTLTDFFEKIKPAFLQWGREYGLSFMGQFRVVELNRLTTEGAMATYVHYPVLYPRDWTQNLFSIQGQLERGIDMDIPALTVNCQSLEIMGVRQPDFEPAEYALHSTTND